MPSCRHSVLIVDDQDDIRETLAEILEDEGYSVVTARDGAVGLELLSARKRVCLVLLDLMMPRLDGWEFVSRIRKDPEFATTPVLLMSGIDDLTGAASALPIQGFLSKPFDLAKLLDAVRVHC